MGLFRNNNYNNSNRLAFVCYKTLFFFGKLDYFNLYLYSLGDIQYDLEEAAHVRAKLLKMYESVDIIR